MILYLDASAIVKRYITETGSTEVNQIISSSEVVGTSLLSRTEVVAALAKAIRVGVLTEPEASAAVQAFRSQWVNFARMQVTETTVARADSLAWTIGLRGYDALHLASALLWQEAIGEPLTLATFDWQLWDAGEQVGLSVWPERRTR